MTNAQGNRGWAAAIVAAILMALGGATAAHAQIHSSTASGSFIKPAYLSAQPDPATRARLVEGYGKLPLAFEANQGQTNPQVKFLSRGSGYTVFLTGNDAVLTLKRSRPGSRKSREDRSWTLKPGTRGSLTTGDAGREMRASVLTMHLVGADPRAAAAGTDELPGKANYFISNNPKNWRTNVPTYAKVRYKNIYPGVDLVYYGNQGQLEYDFVVAPGADPGAIKFDVAAGLSHHAANGGVKPPLRVTTNGDLLLRIDGEQLRFHKPVIYQPAATPNFAGPERSRRELRTERLPVQGHYRLVGHQVSFEVPKYDRTRPLVIDPAFIYSTFLGGNNYDQASAIAVDSSGSAYVTGFTCSANFPTTPGAFQTVFGGSCDGNYRGGDAFVTKLSPAGSAVVYSTYVGSSSGGTAITVDSGANAYLTGEAYSANFPTTPGAFQTTFGGGSFPGDAFVTKLNPTGSALVYSTYLGGAGPDQGYGIAVDGSGHAYLTGVTDSTNFPTTPGAFQTACTKCTNYDDVFVTELNSAGSALVYSTYLGGTVNDSDFGSAIALNASGNAYVTGTAYSSDFPTTPGAFSNICGGPFVTEFNSTGSALVYSTCLGSNTGNGQGIAIDLAGNAYVAGYTYSTTFPTTPGAFQTTCAGSPCSQNPDAFITKMNPSGSALIYSTYLGGAASDEAYGIAIDAAGDAFVSGTTTSNNFPTTPGSPQPNYLTNYAAFCTELNASGSGLLDSTYLGGPADYGAGIAVDSSGDAYVVGNTAGSYPITVGAFQMIPQGNYDGFVTKIGPGDPVNPVDLNFGDQPVGTQSTSLMTTLTNAGTSDLNVSGVSIGGTNASDFSETNTCSGTAIAPGGNCTISVSFRPAASGNRTAALSITDNGVNSPQQVLLTGVGTQGAVTFKPASLTFPTQLIFTSSVPQSLTLTNTGNGTLGITAIATSGNFSQTNTCGSSLQTGKSCTATVTFLPASKGNLAGSLTITDNGFQSPQSVPLSGVGTFVQLSTTALPFGTQPVGTTSLPKQFSITNQGGVALGIRGVFISGADPHDFSQTNNCGSSLARGASCFVTVTFTPTVKGNRSAQVSIIDNGGGSPQGVSLTGTGTF